MADEKMPLTKHLEELRRRLITSLLAVIVGFGISYAFKEQIFAFLARPLIDALPQGSTLQYIGLAEAFIMYLKLSFFGGVFLGLPVILYEIWKFVAPGLHDHEKHYVLPFVICSTLFFIGGATFCYYAVFPFAFRFFLTFSDESIRAIPTLNQYLTFISRMLFAFGVVFEDDNGLDAFANLGIGDSHDTGPHHDRVVLQDRLHLRGGNPIPLVFQDVR